MLDEFIVAELDPNNQISAQTKKECDNRKEPQACLDSISREIRSLDAIAHIQHFPASFLRQSDKMGRHREWYGCFSFSALMKVGALLRNYIPIGCYILVSQAILLTFIGAPLWHTYC